MRDTVSAARGKWKGILLTLGIDGKHLTGKQAPCPACGGKDRFRFDNKEGAGTWYCNHCGAGIGIDLLKLVKGWDFGTAARAVDEVLGRVKADPPGKPKLDPERRKELLRELWKGGRRLEPCDPAHDYLTRHRRLSLAGVDLSDLRYHPGAKLPANLGDGIAPALLALVRDAAGNPASIHRTFLGESGHIGRAMFAGDLPEAIAIRLGAPKDGVLGVAEGLETAIAVTEQFGWPCWSTVNEGYLAKFIPPDDVTRVLIFGDADKSYVGQAAAYHLAKRMVHKGLSVGVHIPSELGLDWADG